MQALGATRNFLRGGAGESARKLNIACHGPLDAFPLNPTISDPFPYFDYRGTLRLSVIHNAHRLCLKSDFRATMVWLLYGFFLFRCLLSITKKP